MNNSIPLLKNNSGSSKAKKPTEPEGSIVTVVEYVQTIISKDSY